MGRAVAEAFARAGYDVALLSREPERLARAAAQLQAAYNMRALAVPTDVAARAIRFAARHRRRTLRIGWSTVRAIIADLIAPGLLDHYLARAGYRGRLTGRPTLARRAREPARARAGEIGAHGRFVQEARNGGAPLFTERHVHALMGGVAIGFLGLAMAFARLRRQARSRS